MCADCKPQPTSQSIQLSSDQSQDQIVIIGLRMSLHGTWRLTLHPTNTHTCKLKQEDTRQGINELLDVEVYFSTYFLCGSEA